MILSNLRRAIGRTWLDAEDSIGFTEIIDFRGFRYGFLAGYSYCKTEPLEEGKMSSELAGKIAAVAMDTAPMIGDVAGYADQQLEEVRAVLAELAPREGCWCSKNLTDSSEPHSHVCARARALYERLQVIQGGCGEDLG